MYDEYYNANYYTSYGSKNKGVPKDVHVMNKAEAKLMRKLQSETGLSEEEIRKHKKYRVMLSDAQKEGQKPKRTKLEKLRDDVMHCVCKRLQLPKEHPDVREAYVEEWEARRARAYWYNPLYQQNPPPIE